MTASVTLTLRFDVGGCNPINPNRLEGAIMKISVPKKGIYARVRFPRFPEIIPVPSFATHSHKSTNPFGATLGSAFLIFLPATIKKIDISTHRINQFTMDSCITIFVVPITNSIATNHPPFCVETHTIEWKLYDRAYQLITQ